MTKITFSYEKQSNGKYQFQAIQNDVVLFEKMYSPKEHLNQHLISKAFIEILNEDISKELKQNPDFKWATFDEAKTWMADSGRIDRSIERYAASQR